MLVTTIDGTDSIFSGGKGAIADDDLGLSSNKIKLSLIHVKVSPQFVYTL